MKSLEEVLSQLPPARRRRIARRANELIDQEMTMQELRKARQLTQTSMAEALGIKQEQISRLEKRTDLHLSTLKRHVEALGGHLDLVVRFPNAAPVRLTGLADLPAPPTVARSRQKRAAAPAHKPAATRARTA